MVSWCWFAIKYYCAYNDSFDRCWVFYYFYILADVIANYFMLFLADLIAIFLADVYAINMWWMFLPHWSLLKICWYCFTWLMLLPMYFWQILLPFILWQVLYHLCFNLLLALIVNWQMLLPFMWKMENHISYV